MASNIKFKRSAVQNRVPTTAQLELGELALNTYDGKLYTEINTGSAAVVEIGSKLSSLVVDGDNGAGNGDVTFHGATANRDLLWDASADSLIAKDNTKIIVGDGTDLSIYSDGTNGLILSDTLRLKNKSGGDVYLKADSGAAVELYHNDVKRFETTADGVDISGTGSLKLPVGTTAQRNGSPTAGDMRYNSTTGSFEGYTNGWGELGGAGIGIGSTSVNPGSGVVGDLVGVGYTTINFVGAGLSVTGYGTTIVVDIGNAVSRKYGRKIHSYTATNNQTTFTGLSYTDGASQVSVYLNGAKLSAATYTATSGNTVVLGTGASVDDEVEILVLDSGVDITRTVHSFTATAGQTAFTGLGYERGENLDVYLNGIRLAQSDYTATNGTSITLAVGASVGDLLEIVDMGPGAQWESGFGEDNDDIFRFNGGVGIGTTNPTDKLNIVGNAEVIGVLTATTFKGDGSALTGIVADKIFEGNTEVETVDTGSDGHVKITTEGTERLRIDNGGRILKGLTTPRGNYGNNASGVEYGFQIEGTSAIAAGLSIVRNSNDANDGGIVLGKTRATSNGGNTVVQAGDDLGNLTFAGNDGSTMLFGAEIFAEVQSGVGNDDMPADLIFKTNGGSTSTTERLRIDSNGKVGINITSPRALLDLGLGTDASTISNTAADYQLGLHAAQSATGDIGRNIAFISQTIGTVCAAINSVDDGTTDKTALQFLTGNSSSIAERLRITSAGKLDISNPSSGNVINLGSSTVYANAAINIYRLGNGYADMRLSSNYGAKIALAGASDNTDEFYIQQDNGKNGYIWNEANKGITFGTNATGRMWLDSSGNFKVVGISTFNSGVNVGGNLTVTGNLQVDGTNTIVNSTTMTVDDKNIVLGSGAANDAAADGGGITLESGNGNKTFNWVDSTDAWTSSEHIHLGDNKKLLLGAASDLQIYHSSSSNHSYIRNSQGILHIDNYDGDIKIRPADGDEGIKVVSNGAVELYYDNNLKFATNSAGVKVTGQIEADELYIRDSEKILLGTASDLQIYHSGDWNYIQNHNNKNFVIQVKDNENAIVALPDSSVQLYHNNIQTLATTDNGIVVYGVEGGDAVLHLYSDEGDDWNDKTRIRKGEGDDLYIDLYNGSAWENSARFITNDAVYLYFNGTKKIETTSGGAQISNGTGDAQLNIRGGSTDGRATLQFISDDANANNDNFRLRNDANNDFYIQNYASGSWETNIKLIGDGAVELYYNGTATIKTQSTGQTIQSNYDLRFVNGTWSGESTKLQHHDNKLYLQGGSDGLRLRNIAGSRQIKMDNDGHFGPDNGQYYNLGSSSHPWSHLYARSATFYDNGTSSPLVDIRSDDGSPWQLQIANDSYSTGAYGLNLHLSSAGNGIIRLQTGASSAYKTLYLGLNNGSTTLECLTLTSTATTSLNRIYAPSMTLSDNGSTSPLLDVRADDGSPWQLQVANDSYSTGHHGLNFHVGNDGTAHIRMISKDANYEEMRFGIQNTSGSLQVFDIVSTGIEINANYDIEFDGSGNWTGNNRTKIQHHSNNLYITGGTSGIRLRTYDGSVDAIHIDSSGGTNVASTATFSGSVKANSAAANAVWITTGGDLHFDGSGNWTGNDRTKIQYHSNTLYICGGTSGIRFRNRAGSDEVFLNDSCQWQNFKVSTDIRFPNGTSTWTGESPGKIQHHGNCLYIQGGTGTQGHIFRSGTANNDSWYIHSANPRPIEPAVNDAYDIGTNDKRVRRVYSNKVSINTGSTTHPLVVNGGSSQGVLSVRNTTLGNGNVGILFSTQDHSGGREKVAIYHQETHGGAHYAGDLVYCMNNATGSATQVSISDERFRMKRDGRFEIKANNTSTAYNEPILKVQLEGQATNDKTLLSLWNGSATGDLNSQTSHIDFVFQDGNTNVKPQARISGTVGHGGDANAVYLEGKGYLTFHCSNTSNDDGDENPGQRLKIAHDGTFTGSSSNNISDQRLKENIATITNATTKIKGLTGRTFTWRKDADMQEGTKYGFIAQEVEPVVEELVCSWTGIRVLDKDGKVTKQHEPYLDRGDSYAKSVNVDGVVPILVEALKEAIAKIETLETKVAALESS